MPPTEMVVVVVKIGMVIRTFNIFIDFIFKHNFYLYRYFFGKNSVGFYRGRPLARKALCNTVVETCYEVNTKTFGICQMVLYY